MATVHNETNTTVDNETNTGVQEETNTTAKSRQIFQPRQIAVWKDWNKVKIFENSEIVPLPALLKRFSSSNLRTFLIGLITVFVFVSNIEGSQIVSPVMIDTKSEGKNIQLMI